MELLTSRSVGSSLAASAIILVVTLTAYRSALNGVFLFDDVTNIVENRSVAAGIFDRGNWSSTRPLTQMSFAANYAWSKLDPNSYHWTNHLIHAVAGMFLFLWLRESFNSVLAERGENANLMSEVGNHDEDSTKFPRRTTIAALLASLMWVVHPINTQAISYVVQRGESLMGLFFFAFLYFVAKSYKKNTLITSLLFQILAILALILGLASKQVMLTAVPVGLMYVRFVCGYSWRNTFLKCCWLWIGALGLLVLGFFTVLPIVVGGEAGVGFKITKVTWIEYLRTQPEVVLHYTRLLLWPAPLILDHGWPPQDDVKKVVLATILLLSGFSAFVFAMIRGYRFAFFPIAALLVLLPTSSFIPMQDLAFEHRMYVPSGMLIAFFLGVLLTVTKASSSQTYGAATVCVAMIVGGVWATDLRNRDYHSAVGMWEDVVAKTIGAGREHFLAGRLYNNLGNAYADDQKWDKSLKALERAVENDTFSGPTFANLARGYLATGQLEKAKAATMESLKRQPKNARVHQQLGLIAVKSGKIDEALEHFVAASQLDPSDRVILANVAQAYLDKGQLAEAELWLEKILRIDPSDREANRNRIILIAQRGDLQLAAGLFEKYLTQYPDDGGAMFSLARIQLMIAEQAKGNATEAMETLKRCVALPEPPRGANFLLANLYRQQGSTGLARTHYEQETRVDPRNADAWNNLAGLTVSMHPGQAIEYFEKVLAIAPDYHQAAYNIAVVQASNGQIEAAAQRLERLLSRAEFPPARQLLQKIQLQTAP